MELSIFDVIKGVVNTPKSLELRHKLGKITFKINQHANKTMVKDAVERIWNVKVRDVKVINIAGKTATVMRKQFQRPGTKKAIITLKEGFRIDLPDQYETMGLGESTPKAEK